VNRHGGVLPIKPSYMLYDTSILDSGCTWVTYLRGGENRCHVVCVGFLQHTKKICRSNDALYRLISINSHARASIGFVCWAEIFSCHAKLFRHANIFSPTKHFATDQHPTPHTTVYSLSHTYDGFLFIFTHDGSHAPPLYARRFRDPCAPV
jgi:hypothetical protein